MATATSSTTSTATLQMKHPSVEQTRKRIDPRRRQAALDFLSNISLDGRPVQDAADSQNQEESSPPEARTSRQPSLVSPERSAGLGDAGTPETAAAAAATTATQALALANQARLASSWGSVGTGPVASPAGADSDGDAFTPSTFNSPFSAPPASARGRLQTYTQGILPAHYSRQFPPGFSLEGGQTEQQRSR